MAEVAESDGGNWWESALDIVGGLGDTVGDLYEVYTKGEAQKEAAKRHQETAVPGTTQENNVQRNSDGSIVGGSGSATSNTDWVKWLLIGLAVLLLIIVFVAALIWALK